MCEEIYKGLGDIQPEGRCCPEYEVSKCPKSCEIRKKLLGANNILTINERTRIGLKNYIIRNFDNECEKGIIQ